MATVLNEVLAVRGRVGVGVTLVGLRWGKISLSQVVAMLIEQWDELGEGVQGNMAELLRGV